MLFFIKILLDIWKYFRGHLKKFSLLFVSTITLFTTNSDVHNFDAGNKKTFALKWHTIVNELPDNINHLKYNKAKIHKRSNYIVFC